MDGTYLQWAGKKYLTPHSERPRTIVAKIVRQSALLIIPSVYDTR
jgi:hypothetical protein